MLLANTQNPTKGQLFVARMAAARPLILKAVSEAHTLRDYVSPHVAQASLAVRHAREALALINRALDTDYIGDDPVNFGWDAREQLEGGIAMLAPYADLPRSTPYGKPDGLAEALERATLRFLDAEGWAREAADAVESHM